MIQRIVPEHVQLEHLTAVYFFPPHDERKESAEFIDDKKELKAEGRYTCFINNGRCEGHIELHHSVIEFSEDHAIDWEKVRIDHPNIDHVDDIDQMMPLCHKHHMGKGTGIHKTTYQAWLAQKYLTAEALDKFEKAIEELINSGIQK